ncbi:hypothetical protein Tco_1178706 [Tanacetum coccineum]
MSSVKQILGEVTSHEVEEVCLLCFNKRLKELNAGFFSFLTQDWYHAVGVICVRDAKERLIWEWKDLEPISVGLRVCYLELMDLNMPRASNWSQWTRIALFLFFPHNDVDLSFDLVTLVVSNRHCNEKCEETLQHEPYDISKEPEEALEVQSQGELNTSKVLKACLADSLHVKD